MIHTTDYHVSPRLFTSETVRVTAGLQSKTSVIKAVSGQPGNTKPLRLQPYRRSKASLPKCKQQPIFLFSATDVWLWLQKNPRRRIDMPAGMEAGLRWLEGRLDEAATGPLQEAVDELFYETPPYASLTFHPLGILKGTSHDYD